MSNHIEPPVLTGVEVLTMRIEALGAIIAELKETVKALETEVNILKEGGNL